MRQLSVFIFFLSLCLSCETQLVSENPVASPKSKAAVIPNTSFKPEARTIKEKVQNSPGLYRVNPEANSIRKRVKNPTEFYRVNPDVNSFAYYLQNFPLKPDGTKVHYFNGQEKHTQTYHAAILDIDVGERDLQQCADAVMRLRAEYLYHQKKYNDIHFNFTNGFLADYSTWRSGRRIQVKGNKVTWYESNQESESYKSFRKYLDMVFSYAGTLSLSKELNSKPIADINIGDVFIQGGSPGHAVLVMDVAIHEDTGEKIFLLAQSYMPAQDIHLLKNKSNNSIDPWYTVLDIKETLNTPEWTFSAKDLKSF